MNLIHLTDTTLLSDTKHLVTREREFLTKILHHLKEIDRRKLYSDLGYSSLFDYCLKELGYSESSAYRRIQAARLLTVLPEIEDRIESGILSLSNISQAQQFFNQNDVEKNQDKLAILDQLENLTKKEGEKMLFVISGEEKPEKEHQRRISADKTRVTIILTDKTLEKCELLRDLMGKSLPYTDLINQMADISIAYMEKKRFKVLRLSKDSLPPAKVNRVISAATKREVYQRDKKCVKCGSSRNLNFDHQIPFALGGHSGKENIRILCFNCNQRARLRARL